MPESLIIISEKEITNIIKDAVSFGFEKYISSTTSKEKERSKFQSNLIYIEEASEITGWAQSIIRKKCHYGLMPYSKPKGTKRLIFRRDELLSIIESGKREIKSETESPEILMHPPKTRKR